jgi:transcriptional regulator with XRE-family HTH domain
MEISDLIKSARIEKGLTQQQLADVVFVTRQTISKWELGKSVPDQASLILLYQYLDIKDNEKKQLSKLIFNKQNIILILIGILKRSKPIFPTQFPESRVWSCISVKTGRQTAWSGITAHLRSGSRSHFPCGSIFRNVFL